MKETLPGKLPKPDPTKPIKIGIPRALLFHHYEKLWTTFFNEVGIEYVISPETNKEILATGTNLAIDEACLPTKILLGHVAWLLDKCDYILLPRVEFVHKIVMCTKFMGQYDLVTNTFRDRDLKILYYNLWKKKPKAELKCFIKMGKFLGLKKGVIKEAYAVALRAQEYYELYRDQEAKKLLTETQKNKVLVVAHPYNVGDDYVGAPIIRILKSLNCVPILATDFNLGECVKHSSELSTTLPWVFNRQLVGAIALYRNQVDGIIILTTFPCGPDSMVNEMIIRKVKDTPILTLTIDTQDGTAGTETRLESFVDILNFQKERDREN